MTANWDLRGIDTVGLLAVVSFPLALAPVALALNGQTNTGALLASGSWLVVMAYESGMIDSLKAELSIL